MQTDTDMLPIPDVAGVSHRYAIVDGLRIHYAEAGAGEPLVMLHGWPQHWYAWRRLIGPLATRYRVICPDTRGFGWSQGSGDGYRLDRLGDDVIGLLDGLGLGQAKLVGHDLGGAVGYRACLDHPERFARFAAVATMPPWMTLKAPPTLFLRPWHFYLLAAPGARHIVARGGLIESRLRAWRHTGEFTADEITTYTRTTARAASAAATARFYRGVVLRELPGFLLNHHRRYLTVPTLHLNGEYDALTTALPQPRQKNAYDLTMETIAESGHFVAEEQPVRLLERLNDFLD
jgi:pimeloyl-ACP methyl ester carboxylesterase